MEKPAMATKSIDSFKIENNILIGKKDPIDECINIGELILSAFKSRPDFIGQVDAETEEEHTFQQMRERSVKCAIWLKKIGVQRNDIVTVCTSNCLDAYIPFLASLYIGATLTIWRDSLKYYSEEHIRCCPKVIFTDFDKASKFLNLVKKMNFSTKIIVFKKETEKQKQFKSLNFILNNDFDEDEVDKFCCTKLESNKDTAVILFSSDSNDSSSSDNSSRKHVTIPYSFFTSPSSKKIPVLLPDEIGMWVESLDWNISLLLTVRCILSCVKAVKVYKYIKGIDTKDKVKENLPVVIRKYKVNWFFVKVSMIQILYQSNFFKDNMPSLKQLLISCKILPLKFILRIVNARMLPETNIVPVYCLPETGVIAFYKHDKKKSFNFYIARNVSLFFADFNTGSPLKVKEYGNIRCKSPCLTNGYFDSSDRRIRAAIDDKGWFHTSEFGFYFEDNIAILERGVGQVISCDNYRLSPFLLELHLKMHAAVQNAVLIPIKNQFDPKNQDLMAVVIKKTNAEVTEKEIIQYFEKGDHPVRLRAGVLFMERLPHFFTGHVDRKEIYNLASNHINNFLRKQRFKTRRK